MARTRPFELLKQLYPHETSHIFALKQSAANSRLLFMTSTSFRSLTPTSNLCIGGIIAVSKWLASKLTQPTRFQEFVHFSKKTLPISMSYKKLTLLCSTVNIYYTQQKTSGTSPGNSRRMATMSKVRFERPQLNSQI